MSGAVVEADVAVVLGMPLHVSTKVPQGNIWGLASSRAFVVMRTNTDVQISRAAFFSSDHVAVRTTVRIGFTFPTLKAVAKIALAPPDEITATPAQDVRSCRCPSLSRCGHVARRTSLCSWVSRS